MHYIFIQRFLKQLPLLMLLQSPPGQYIIQNILYSVCLARIMIFFSLLQLQMISVQTWPHKTLDMKQFGAGEMALQLRSLADHSWRGPTIQSPKPTYWPITICKPQFQGTQHHLPPYSNIQAHAAHRQTWRQNQKTYTHKINKKFQKVRLMALSHRRVYQK